MYSMLTAVKNQLFTNWHSMRWVSLGLGVILGFNWMVNSAPISGFLALFFIYQAVTNTGCLAGRCVPVQDDKGGSGLSENIEFKEIK